MLSEPELVIAESELVSILLGLMLDLITITYTYPIPAWGLAKTWTGTTS